MGYKLLDCACDYGNEIEVGKGIANAIAGGMKRSDIFVTSKLWNTYHEAKYVRAACEKTLADLGLEYLDLYLIHFPIAMKYVPMDELYPPGWVDSKTGQYTLSNATLQETWGAMEELVRAGLVRNIGVANMNCSLLGQLLRYQTIRPAVLQVERHPQLVQPRLSEYCNRENIRMTSYSSFGGQSYVELGMQYEAGCIPLLEHPVVATIAQAHGKTIAQVLLKWNVQSNIAIIPKSSQPGRLAENADMFSWDLTSEEMATLNKLDEKRRFNDPGTFMSPGIFIYD